MRRFVKGKRGLTRQRFAIVRMVIWSHTVIWVAVCLWFMWSWDWLPWYVKAFALALLVFFTPSLEDLFYSYSRYLSDGGSVDGEA